MTLNIAQDITRNKKVTIRKQRYEHVTSPEENKNLPTYATKNLSLSHTASSSRTMINILAF